MATAEEIRAAIQAGPQTQAALDQAFATYTPAQMLAAFPEYAPASTSNDPNAGLRAYEAAAEASRARLADTTVAGPTGGAPYVAPGGSKSSGYSRDYTPAELASIRAVWAGNQNTPAALMKAMQDTGVSVKDIALAVAGSGDASTLQGFNNFFTQAGAPAGFGGMYQASDMSANDKSYIDWMLTQPDPLGRGTMADVYKSQGIDPYTNPGVLAQAKSQNQRSADRAGLITEAGQTPVIYNNTGDPNAQIAAWQNPNWKAAQDARAAALAANNAAQTAASPGVRVGGGLLTGGTGTTTPVVPPTGTNISGLLTTPPNLPPGQTGNLSTFGSTLIPTGAANQYSRQYPQQDLANIRDWWSKTYGNREQAMSDMTKYGITTQDLAMATGQPFQGLSTYLKEGGAPAGFGGAIEGAGGLFKRAADMAQQPGIQFGTTQGLLSDPTSQLARNILARDTQYQQTAPVMGSGRFGMPSIAPGTGLLAPDYWLAAKTAAAQKTEPVAPTTPVNQQYPGY
jgi:hypothetical protein